MTKVCLVIQARTGSSRLPGKVLKPFNKDETVLEYQCRQLNRISGVDRIIVATTDKPQDDAIAEVANKVGIDYVRGSERDTLSRFMLVVEKTQAEHIIRITSDSPLRPAGVIQRCLHAHLESGADYTRPKDHTLPKGLRCEIITSACLRKLHQSLSTASKDREHVTLAARRDPSTFQHNLVDFTDCALTNEELAYDFSIDTPEDYQTIVAVFSYLNRQQWPSDLLHLCKAMKAIKMGNSTRASTR